MMTKTGCFGRPSERCSIASYGDGPAELTPIRSRAWPPTCRILPKEREFAIQPLEVFEDGGEQNRNWRLFVEEDGAWFGDRADLESTVSMGLLTPRQRHGRPAPEIVPRPQVPLQVRFSPARYTGFRSITIGARSIGGSARGSRVVTLGSLRSTSVQRRQGCAAAGGASWSRRALQTSFRSPN
jgi:hypothetical protein